MESISTNFGVSTSTENADYSGSFVDWGKNQIGTNAPNTWPTLTYDEWYYLRHTRTNADSLFGIAQVNGVNGLIFLPDDWTCPSGVIIKSGFFDGSNAEDYANQTFTADQWSKMESAGAIFLPAAGIRIGLEVLDVQLFGDYWSATEYDSDKAYRLVFIPNLAYVRTLKRSTGQSVRLVKDL